MLIGVKRKKIVSLLLLFSLVALSGKSMAQAWKATQVRKGAKLKIQKNDGQQVTGELISVEKDSLLLSYAETNADVSEKILIKEVKTITIVTRSRVLQVGVYGVLAGILYGSATKKQSRSFEPNQQYFTFGAIGGVTGAVLGTVLGMNKKIQIQGKSDAEIQKTLEKLSKNARVPGIQ
ncbi:hypothetical protein ACFLQZ_03240 [Acidobacteriota bacterium]